MTFGDYRDACERAAAGLQAYGVGPGVNVSWQLPTWIESFVLVGALSRLGAVQNPILPIYRAKEVGFVLRQTNAQLMIVPSTWRGFDYEAMVREIGVCDVLVCDGDLPDGDPVALPTGADRRKRGRAGSSSRRGRPLSPRARSTATPRSPPGRGG